MSTMEMPRDPGPWGPRAGLPFDDGVYSHVKQVRVHLGESLKVLYGIEFGYIHAINGRYIKSPIHGDEYKNGVIIEEVNLDGVDEYLTGISGFYGPVEGYEWEGITSISFHTNKGIHGPYGEGSGEAGVYFTSPSCPGKVLGFHGRGSVFLIAIGVHMQYFEKE